MNQVAARGTHVIIAPIWAVQLMKEISLTLTKNYMNKSITLLLTVFCLVLQPSSAQTPEQNNYKYHKAIELIETDGDLKQVRKLLNENIQENTKHIMSYVLLAQVDMHEGDYSSALLNLEKAIKLNYKKSGTSDASAEFVSRVRTLLDKNKVIWQTGELGKVDMGGGGTVAMYIANLDVDVIDVGVPVLSMHAPYEVTSKLDVYMAYRAFLVFMED